MPRSSAIVLALLSCFAAPVGCSEDDLDRPGPSEQESEGTDGGPDTDLCIEECKPLEQNCGPGRTCLPDQPGFSCSSLPAGPRPGLHEPCEAGSQTCEAGLMCAQAAAPGCEGSSGCCVAICDTEDPECTDGTACYPIFEASQMCFENVGLCVI